MLKNQILKIVVASDNERIIKVCEDILIPCIKTNEFESATSKIHAVSLIENADFICKLTQMNHCLVLV
ncbi:hypothetical protein FMM56_00005 [Campylobacter sp. LR264d]|uniref:hypothetical protein n=1 Tax=Campylobacter sp. LR264d TaxID=2593544 RepID=UPI00123889C4|nr:hypothetical protein [Campylobacter sp. LR264d]KAA6234436.1 hypothetical protein FMM56_00005 [Campylobacter sp. LR264d]